MIYYLDITGDRQWTGFFGAKSVLGRGSDVGDQDVIFVHLTDFLDLIDRQYIFLHFDDESDKWKAFADQLNEVHFICNPQCGIVFLTGESPDLVENQDVRGRVLRTISGHVKTEVAFEYNVPHGASAHYLKRRYVRVLKVRCELGMSISSCFENCEEDNDLEQRRTVFRWLAQAYVLARKRKAIDISLLRRKFWEPVLKNGSLDPKVIERLRNEPGMEVFSNHAETGPDWPDRDLTDDQIGACFDAWEREMSRTSSAVSRDYQNEEA